MINNYYIYFNLSDNINYIYLLKIYKNSSYNKASGFYDTIHYKTQKQLAEIIDINYSTLKTIINNNNYNSYFTVDTTNKVITLNNNFKKNERPFIILSAVEVDYLLNINTANHNLFIKYFIYIKYFCGLYKNKEQDFTTKQFLRYVGLSDTSGKMVSLISNFNTILKQSDFITIRTDRDAGGHSRNFYSLN